jgi:hypothetical protein
MTTYKNLSDATRAQVAKHNLKPAGGLARKAARAAVKAGIKANRKAGGR